MNQKIVLLLIAAIGVLAIVKVTLFSPSFSPSEKNSLTNSSKAQATNAETAPSQTLKTYSDPTGFSFNYPDNLSILNNELKDDSTYAELQLTAKGVSGNLALKITDSKIASLDEWAKQNAPSKVGKDAKLGKLKALEINLDNKLLLGALDQGVLFTIEIPKERQDFWIKVYNKVLTDFSFTPPSQDTTPQGAVAPTTNDVSFEGEEVVE